MGPSTQDFYDDMSESYHLIYEDWKHTVSSQGEFWDRWIRSRFQLPGSGRIRILDASCGIGTQSLGLALQGFEVTATDLSPNSVERARREAEAMGLSIRFGTADFRTLEQDVAGTFDVVFSADNAVPHLLTDEDLMIACRQFYNKCLPGGMVIITIRDYDSLIRERPRATQPRILNHGKRIVFQVWDWSEDGSTYTTRQFILQDQLGTWKTESYAAMYRAVQRSELSYFLQQAGFQRVEWVMPEQSGFYQPIVTAAKF
ncbi:2-polyprenyl-3-methyl-5-hydroxy-6-metoxy-1,4-benzoquinol methylase [Paenibacillus rhizosphaerae]|uniref:2-polyprenyl-3-methyl-5-hydroxy-6-metoxy-1, 4-benzoquinol methylase n=1 Tax=Paenibacillus rhizosphaerae TaxID=297318 RepID=A0A839TJV3_9BACL|nr:class I SAM-dependent methyltransferase [Paenibacillus rhizosphaerae]MBB3126030.1 2-polyprenyl-3-methyl-5-hydroxy-6-metoxy-1,4-benzoquinol methylase [Paenibacillus rhizosphaerae]